MPNIAESKILVLATNGFEQSELEVPLTHLRKRGAKVQVASPDGEDIRGWNEKDWGDVFHADLSLADAKADDFDALVLPGGQINPDILRTIPEAVKLVQAFCEQGKTIAAICHGPWLLVEADVLRGRKATSFHSIKTDVRNAGAEWEDSEVVVDNAIVTSRSPEDLPAFIDKIVEEIEEGRHQRAA